MCPNRCEVRPHTSCLSGLVLGMAGLLIVAGVVVRLAPLLLDLARAHSGAIALAEATVLLLATATRSRP